MQTRLLGEIPDTFPFLCLILKMSAGLYLLISILQSLAFTSFLSIVFFFLRITYMNPLNVVSLLLLCILHLITIVFFQMDICPCHSLEKCFGSSSMPGGYLPAIFRTLCPSQSDSYLPKHPQLLPVTQVNSVVQQGYLTFHLCPTSV